MKHPLIALLATSLWLIAPPAGAAGEEDQSRWEGLREMLYPGRTLHDGGGVIRLDAPDRAHDAAVVPIGIGADFPQTDARYIKTITLIVDQNPVPVVGTFHLSPANGLASIGTRVRVNEYTHVRAIAETNDGELYMTSRYVKASGGCSAPAGKDADAALARIGRMKFKPLSSPVPGQPTEAQLLISHPNNTGMQMDQVTRHYLPAHFVKEIRVRYGDQPILTVESGISLSEDPSIHFSFLPDQRKQISVEVVDNQDGVFTADWPVEPVPGT